MRYCTKCGTKIAEDDKFCPVCGAVQSSNEPNSTSTVYNPIAREALEKIEDSNKSRTVAAILCFLLGGLGAHDFYLGKKGRAIGKIMIFSFGLIVYIFSYAYKLATDSMLNGSAHQELLSSDLTQFEALILSLPSVICSIIIGIWTLVDFIMIIIGKYKDSEGKLVTNWAAK